MKNLLVVISIHHNNTLKIADVIAKILDAQITKPSQITPEEIQEYDIVGFGSGIYGEKHHKSLLDLADKLSRVNNRKAFIFSTSSNVLGVTTKTTIDKDHKLLREKLQSKGYTIIDEFNCKGFNTNSYAKYFGGINKSRPNDEDIKNAEEFAQNLKKKSN